MKKNPGLTNPDQSGRFVHPGFNEITLFLLLRWIISSISIPWGSLSVYGSQYFFTNNPTFSCISTNKEFIFNWNLTYRGFDIQYFIPNLLTASYFKSLSFVKARGSFGIEEELLKYPQSIQKSPRFSLTSSF